MSHHLNTDLDKFIEVSKNRLNLQILVFALIK